MGKYGYNPSMRRSSQAPCGGSSGSANTNTNTNANTNTYTNINTSVFNHPW